MQSPKVLSTVIDITKRYGRGGRSDRIGLGRVRRAATVTAEPSEAGHEPSIRDCDEFRLPKRSSLAIVQLTAFLLQISFFIIVSSSSAYAELLGGSATFSGLVIGIPTVFSGLALIPLMRFDQGTYKRPLHIACAFSVIGNILYGLAYRVRFLYLILISRIVLGLAFTFWMYSKRYCSDPRIVGIRRRTLLAGWIVAGQGGGLSIGPFLGGLLFKLGLKNEIFNGYTSPGWIMAGVWLIFWAFAAILFEDVPRQSETPVVRVVEPATQLEAGMTSDDHTGTFVPTSYPPSALSEVVITEIIEVEDDHRMTYKRWGVIICMCWYAMTCFFILGGWEANIPVFTSSMFHWTPFAAGNLIALGGLTTFPFLFLNIMLAKRVQDRHTLALGSGIGLMGLLIMIAIVRTEKVNFGTLYLCWFLVALGCNLASTVTLSLLSKQLPGSWNSKISLAIQYSNYTGRVLGAVWGGAGIRVGMLNYLGLQIAIVGIGGVMFLTLWRELKAKTG